MDQNGPVIYLNYLLLRNQSISRILYKAKKNVGKMIYIGEVFDLQRFTLDFEACSEVSSFSLRWKYFVDSTFKKLLSLNRRFNGDSEKVWFMNNHFCRTTCKLILLRRTTLRSAAINLRFRAHYWIFFLFTSLKIFRKFHIHEIDIIEQEI